MVVAVAGADHSWPPPGQAVSTTMRLSHHHATIFHQLLLVKEDVRMRFIGASYGKERDENCEAPPIVLVC
jgi:hypothetical protein